MFPRAARDFCARPPRGADKRDTGFALPSQRAAQQDFESDFRDNYFGCTILCGFARVYIAIELWYGTYSGGVFTPTPQASYHYVPQTNERREGRSVLREFRARPDETTRLY